MEAQAYQYERTLVIQQRRIQSTPLRIDLRLERCHSNEDDEKLSKRYTDITTCDFNSAPT